jgi:hypothetical protein
LGGRKRNFDVHSHDCCLYHCLPWRPA